MLVFLYNMGLAFEVKLIFSMHFFNILEILKGLVSFNLGLAFGSLSIFGFFVYSKSDFLFQILDMLFHQLLLQYLFVFSHYSDLGFDHLLERLAFLGDLPNCLLILLQDPRSHYDLELCMRKVSHFDVLRIELHPLPFTLNTILIDIVVMLLLPFPLFLYSLSSKIK